MRFVRGIYNTGERPTISFLIKSNYSMLSNILQKPLILLGVGVLAIALIFAVRSAQDAKALRVQLEEVKKNTQQSSDAEVTALVAEIGQLIALPEGDKPTVATITDREKLKDVPFFSKAENNDKVLMYVTSRKAILYRPSAKKIIEVATLNLSSSPIPNATFAAKVVLRNGTDITGLTKSFEDALKKGLPKVEVVARDNAKQTTFADTIVVDLTGSKKEDAQRLATTLGAKVGDLPADEVKPTGADFLVIIGKNKTTNVAPSGSASPAPASSSAPSPTAAPE
jgi:hypothetical protein